MKYTRKYLILIIALLAGIFMGAYPAFALSVPMPQPLDPIERYEGIRELNENLVGVWFNNPNVVRTHHFIWMIEFFDEGFGEQGGNRFEWFIREDGRLILEFLKWSEFWDFDVDERVENGWIDEVSAVMELNYAFIAGRLALNPISITRAEHRNITTINSIPRTALVHGQQDSELFGQWTYAHEDFRGRMATINFYDNSTGEFDDFILPSSYDNFRWYTVDDTRIVFIRSFPEDFRRRTSSVNEVAIANYRIENGILFLDFGEYIIFDFFGENTERPAEVRNFDENLVDTWILKTYGTGNPGGFGTGGNVSVTFHSDKTGISGDNHFGHSRFEWFISERGRLVRDFGNWDSEVFYRIIGNQLILREPIPFNSEQSHFFRQGTSEQYVGVRRLNEDLVGLWSFDRDRGASTLEFFADGQGLSRMPENGDRYLGFEWFVLENEILYIISSERGFRDSIHYYRIADNQLILIDLFDAWSTSVYSKIENR